MQISPFVTVEIACLLDAIIFWILIVCSHHRLDAISKGAGIISLDTCGKRLALLAIRAYQRYLSPYKGYSCAYRVLTGRDSCSAYGYKVIARHGLRPGLALLQRRLRACGERHRQHGALQPPAWRSARRQAQAGYCDCDVPLVDCACDCADVVNVLSCSWPSHNKQTSWFRNSYTTSAALKQQQAAHRKKIRQGQNPDN